VQEHQVDIHACNDDAFQIAYQRGHINIAKWLVQDHQADVHEFYEYAFLSACGNGHIEIAKWFIKKYKNNVSPYYYHDRTGYILNHEPLKYWKSCTILDCPIIYIGELDEPAVIAYIATLKRPKSARSLKK
jgi:carbohydrate-binding DOMON domain-containing protein